MTEGCYKYWLNSRKNKMEHPQESFRRVLYSHLRGSYGRKAFSEAVELSLLRILRKTDERNYPINAWKNCFPEANTDIGKPGFEKLGYHESRKKSAERESMVSTVHAKYVPIAQKPGEEWKVVFVKAKGMKSLGLPRKRGRQKRKATMSNINCPKELSEIPLSSIRLCSPEEDQKKTLNSLVNYPGGGGALMQKFRQILDNYYSDYEVKLLQEASKERGVFLVSPALQFMLSSTQLKTDPRFADDLLCPPPQQQLFFPHRKIGTYVVDYSTWRVRECDLLAIDILQRDLVGLHALEFVESPMETLIAFVKSFPLLQETGSTWCRLRAIRGDGKRIGLLFKVRLLSKLIGLIQFQEQSQTYGSMLDTPLLL